MKKIIIIVILIIIVGGVYFIIDAHTSKEQIFTKEDLELKALLEKKKKDEKVDKIKISPEIEKRENEANIFNEKENIICPANYAPVCSMTKTVEKTFSNLCKSKAEKAMYLYDGECQKPEVKREVKEKEEIKVLKIGNFNENAEDSDAAHKGDGDLQIIEFKGEKQLIFEDNFYVTRGPNYKIYLLTESDIETELKFRKYKSGAYNIGDLKQYSGYQSHKIPDNIDISKIKSIVVWCEAFSQFITTANIK